MNNDKKYKITYIDNNKFKMDKDDFNSFTELYCTPVFIDSNGNTYTLYETKIIIKERNKNPIKVRRLKCLNCGKIIAMCPEDLPLPEYITRNIVCCNDVILEWV